MLRVVLLTFFSMQLSRATPPVIVIDPGHGGSDHGAAYHINEKTILEKDITLELSQALSQVLEKMGYTVVLTRTTDQEMPLTERTVIANKLKAKLFISVHINTSTNYRDGAQKPEGIETFILNHSTPASSKRLADLENAVLKGSVAEQPKNEVGLIIKDLLLDSNRMESKKLACLIQMGLVKATSPTPQDKQKRNRGVKEGLFYILLGADMPSVLVEAGFFGHPKDQFWLRSPQGRASWIQALALAVDSYFKIQNTTKIRQLLNSCQKH
ncbi:MAG: N-acetylmuramoyl-L-alanine amidase [Xanthomonadaceae bacterium]|nr:N-acetylmuramoyl-L-alanine amidase [Xanthomonadaceae bacterium]